MNLKEKLDRVNTREDFVSFLGELLHNLHTHPSEWGNFTLETYLEAMLAWMADAEGYYGNLGMQAPDTPTWKTCGEMLLAAKVYE